MSARILTRRGEVLRDALLMVGVGVFLGLTICSPFVIWLGGAR